ncbi:MAG: ATP-binding cassette domain-containing protein [Akkermansiaceae bacterium]
MVRLFLREKTRYGALSMNVESAELPFHIRPGQSWGIVGRNGSGKSTLGARLAGESGSGFKRRALVSFELEDQLLEREIREDDSEFMDRQDPGRSVAELIEEVRLFGAPSMEELVAELEMTEYLHRGFRLLSTGERRRLMLARALARSPDFLILDEPFDGIDQGYRIELAAMLKRLARRTTLVIVANRLSDLDGLVDHLVCVEHGEVVLSGARGEVENNPAFHQLLGMSEQRISIPGRLDRDAIKVFEGTPVVMKDVTVIHGGREIISHFDWRVEKGQNWKISGPNGCGKSTLVNLVTGDHPQCYSNEVAVMGMRRGMGETIWDVKNHIGIISPALHQLYRVSVTALASVVSGFFDSVGVYQDVSPGQLKVASQWLEVVGLTVEAEKPFRSLSYGQQRLLLIARALVKQPPLLILDEPCQGLDPLNRALVLRVIDRIVSTGLTQLLYITHEPEDRLDCVTHHLQHDGSGWSEYCLIE